MGTTRHMAFAEKTQRSQPLSSDQAILEVQKVAYTTSKGAILLKDISFSAKAGEIIALVGPNGAGKTTLIRMLAGLAQPSKGSLDLNGIPLVKMSHAMRARQIAYVGQSDSIDGRLTVQNYVGLGHLPFVQTVGSSSAKERQQHAIEAVGLTQFANRRLDQLSGGERQKAKIARAMCQAPSLLILDEPTNHLDPHARGELLGLVAEMGITVIAALHDLTLIEAFANKALMIENGRMRHFGAVQEALSSDQVRTVFGVDMHRLKHPIEDRFIPTLDIRLSDTKQPIHR